MRQKQKLGDGVMVNLSPSHKTPAFLSLAHRREGVNDDGQFPVGLRDGGASQSGPNSHSSISIDLVGTRSNSWAKFSKAGLKEVLEERKKTRVVEFLMKLYPEFELIHGSLLNMELTPALDVVLAVVFHEETRLGTQAAIESTTFPSTALLVGKSTTIASIGNTKRSVQCYECQDFVALPEAISSALSTSSSGTSNSIKSTWHLDSGASNQMIGDLSQFSSLSSDVSKHVIHTVNEHTLSASGIGSIGNLSNVLYVPNLKANFVSVGQLVDQNCVVKFSPNGCVVQNLKIGMIMATWCRFGRIFLLESDHRHLHHYFLSVSVADVTRSNKLLTLWHNRMGHPHSSWLHHMLKSCLPVSHHIHSSLLLACTNCSVKKVTSSLFHPAHLPMKIHLI
ncbi:hypothetical protein FXO38_03843 [Capsicum annuum]|nr:hypothetical protein FXO38_03843 [Capsicum annuum]